MNLAMTQRQPPGWVVFFTILLLLATGVLMVFAALAGITGLDAVRNTRSVTSSVAVGDRPNVQIDVPAGAVTVIAGDAGRVTLDDRVSVRALTRHLAQLGAERYRVARLSATADGAAVGIPPQPFGFDFLNTSVDRALTIHVPADASVHLSGGNVAATLDGLRGDAEVDVNNGAVRLRNAAVTGSTAVRATNGGVDFEGAINEGARLEMTTTNGAIRARLPAGTNASYDAATTNGSVFVRGRGSGGTGVHMTGVLGSGGSATIYLRAVNGSIAIL
jgi:hypothetical protein